MKSRAGIVLLVVLLAASGAALVNSQRLKTQPDPLSVGRTEKVVSPACRCKSGVARIAFRIREGDRVTVSVIDRAGDRVRTLIDERDFGDRALIRTEWDGRDDSGVPLPDGRYRVRVRLEDQDRTIVLPRSIRLDATPPVVTLVGVEPRTLPAGTRGGRDLVAFRYRVSERAYGLLFLLDRRRLQSRTAARAGTLHWRGPLRGGRLAAGEYEFSVGARDLAGNLAHERPRATVTVR